MRFILTTAIVLLAAACTPMQWARNDARPESVQQDMQQCQLEAWREASWQSFRYFGSYGPLIYRDPFGRRLMAYPQGPFYDPFTDRFLEESRLASFCMRSKGYELAPVKP
jgi:hypothetical protein